MTEEIIPMKKVDVACFQLCSSESVEKNIATIDRMFDSIEKKLDLVCLPEFLKWRALMCLIMILLCRYWRDFQKTEE